MAASTMSGSETFGHYLLPLTMNKGHLDAKQAEYHIQVKTKYLDLKKHRPERHALRNLLGMLHFRLGKYEKSLAYFDKILSDAEDPENLNALANRKYICDKLYRFPESRVCEEKITKLLKSCNTLEEEEEEESRLRRARGLAEQAFAYSFDVFEESVSNERYKKSVDHYDAAIELAGDSLTQDEREDWMISKGMACHKIRNSVYKVKRDYPLQKNAQLHCEVINIFIQIVEKTHDNSLKSESWRHLGELFNKEAKLHFHKHVPDDFKRYIDNPIECFEEAIHLTPNDPRILARYANFLKKKYPESQKAMKYVNKSIQLDETVFNLFAFSVRGLLFLQEYKEQLIACGTGNTSNKPDVSLLTNAEKDFKFTSESHSTPMYLEELAEVHYYMATDCHGNIREGCDGQTLLQQALTACAKAVACQDGEKRSCVHKIRGQCLCALGEHQQSLRSFQRAVECEVANNMISSSGKFLVLEYAHVLKNTSDQHSSQPSLFADMVYWLHKAAKVCILNSGWVDSLNAPNSLASIWKSFVDYCEDKHYTRELEDIQKASRSPGPRHYLMRRRTVSTSGVESQAPLSHMPHSQRATAEARDPRDVKSEDHPPRAPTEPAKAPLYVVPHKRRAQSVTEEGSGAGEANSGKYQAQIESAIASMSALYLDGDETSSEAKQITLTVNLTTRKMQIIDQTSSSQKWTSNDESNKPIRPAPTKAMNRDFPNDFFVIYSSSASEWVFRCLLEELEGSDLKGRIKDRDFKVGKPKLENYTYSIENSACVILVITEDFVNDDWCNRGMLMAIEKNKLLIPVLREGTELPMFLSALTPIDVTGPVDWERLKRCIEQQIKPE